MDTVGGAEDRGLLLHGRILLVSTYELGHQPLGLASPAAFLEAAGFQPVLVDAAIQRLDAAVLAEAAFIGISVPMHTALRLGVDLLHRIRGLPGRSGRRPVVCFYGLYAELNRDFLLRSGADYIIGGEFEGALLALVQAVHGQQQGLPDGVSDTATVRPPIVTRLNYLRPSRAGLPDLARYARLDHGGEFLPVGNVDTTRGCLHTCRHCPIPPVYHGRFFAVPVEIVLDDARRQIEAGARHISFGDPDFLNGPGHARRVIERFHAEFPGITFDCTAKVEHLLRHAALLPKLQAWGCLFIVSAFESISDEVLGYLAKGHNREDELRALELVEGAGIALRPTWIPFTPWTSRTDLVELLDFILDQGLTDRVGAVQFGIKLLIPPGSPLIELAVMQPYLRDLDEASFTYRWVYREPSVEPLERAVIEQVRAGVASSVPDEQIFETLVAIVRGDEGLQRPRATESTRSRSPKLTESWFC